MLRDFSFSVNMHYDFCCPLTYRQLLPQKCYRSYWVASSVPGGLRVRSIQQRELLLCCSSQHHGRVKCFSERAACSSAAPQPEGCSLSPLSVPLGPFFSTVHSHTVTRACVFRDKFVSKQRTNLLCQSN